MLRPADPERAERGRRGCAKEVLPNPDLRLEVCKVTTQAAPRALSRAWPLVKRIRRSLSGVVPRNTQKTLNLTNKAAAFRPRPRRRTVGEREGPGGQGTKDLVIGERIYWAKNTLPPLGSKLSEN